MVKDKIVDDPYLGAAETEGVTLWQFMPPVLDEETQTVTYFCCLCEEVKKTPVDTPVTYFTRTAFPNDASGQSGYVCPQCEGSLTCQE